jgi:DNA-binding response OmpR family regulator
MAGHVELLLLGDHPKETPMALILVVEDDDDVRDFLIFRLQRLGHDVVPAADGESGLHAIRAHRPDLVVTDWNMPRMTGVELCVAIRADPELACLPVLIVTARGSDADRDEALAAGASDVIRKPFVPVELVRRIAALLDAEG